MFNYFVLSYFLVQTVLPQQKLSLIGVKPFYQIGDIVDISCVSGPSKPPAILAWFVNDQQVCDLTVNIRPNCSFLHQSDHLTFFCYH